MRAALLELVIANMQSPARRHNPSGQPFAPADVDRFVPTPEAQAERDLWRAGYLERVLRVLEYVRDEGTRGRAVDLDKVIDEFAAGRI